ncbi:MAG: hypothetical protein EZS28_035460, partial [Streblomastix strix]
MDKQEVHQYVDKIIRIDEQEKHRRHTPVLRWGEKPEKQFVLNNNEQSYNRSLQSDGLKQKQQQEEDEDDQQVQEYGEKYKDSQQQATKQQPITLCGYSLKQADVASPYNEPVSGFGGLLMGSVLLNGAHRNDFPQPPISQSDASSSMLATKHSRMERRSTQQYKPQTTTNIPYQYAPINPLQLSDNIQEGIVKKRKEIISRQSRPLAIESSCGGGATQRNEELMQLQNRTQMMKQQDEQRRLEDKKWRKKNQNQNQNQKRSQSGSGSNYSNNNNYSNNYSSYSQSQYNDEDEIDAAFRNRE